MMSSALPECCKPLVIKVVGFLPKKGKEPPKLIAEIRGFKYHKGSHSSIWMRTPSGEKPNPRYWFDRPADYVCHCGCTIFTIRNRAGMWTGRCENCRTEEPLCLPSL